PRPRHPGHGPPPPRARDPGAHSVPSQDQPPFGRHGTGPSPHRPDRRPRGAAGGVLHAACSARVPVLMRGETNLIQVVPGWKRPLKRLLLKNLFGCVAGFLAVGRYNREFYQDFGVETDRIFLVPYAVNNQLFLAQANRHLGRKADLRRQLSLPADTVTILFSGKLIPQKSPMDVLL